MCRLGYRRPSILTYLTYLVKCTSFPKVPLLFVKYCILTLVDPPEASRDDQQLLRSQWPQQLVTCPHAHLWMSTKGGLSVVVPAA